jgi:dTDP-4-dehydrorhamnose 3,5-epimerase
VTFEPTNIEGAMLLRPQPVVDDRGVFARLWCREALAARGLAADFVQCNRARSTRRGTLRGLHYQESPFAEAKLVRCVRGAIYDVIVDVRDDSPTYRRWLGIELSADDGRMLYVPPGCAHGYQALEDDTDVEYPVTAPYHPEAERGIRWNDPLFGIAWPITSGVTMSTKDQEWTDYPA